MNIEAPYYSCILKRTRLQYYVARFPSSASLPSAGHSSESQHGPSRTRGASKRPGDGFSILPAAGQRRSPTRNAMMTTVCSETTRSKWFFVSRGVRVRVRLWRARGRLEAAKARRSKWREAAKAGRRLCGHQSNGDFSSTDASVAASCRRMARQKYLTTMTSHRSTL
jgi:hypothetical protein